MTLPYNIVFRFRLSQYTKQAQRTGPLCLLVILCLPTSNGRCFLWIQEIRD